MKMRALWVKVGLAVALTLTLRPFPLFGYDDDRELQACPKIQKHFPSFLSDNVVCDNSFIQIEAKTGSKEERSLGIASFNLYELGSDQSFAKDLDAVAAIINQWDVVGVTEINPTPDEDRRHNDKMARALAKLESLEKLSVNLKSSIESAFEMPGYLRLLKALRLLDPAWSLVMASRASGENSSSMELAGFYYRFGRVKMVRDSTICSGGPACTLQELPKDDALVSRRPFVAHFVAGNFDFIGAVTHIRFRRPSVIERDPELASLYFSRLQHYFPTLSVSSSLFGEGEKVSEVATRFGELAALVTSFSEMAKQTNEQDLVFMGDFNLEPNEGNDFEAWNRVLKPLSAKLSVSDKTSLAKKSGLKSSFDHFIFNPSSLKECANSTPAAFDFSSMTASSLETLRSRITKIEEEPEASIASFRLALSEREKLADCNASNCTFKRFYSDKKVKDLVANFKKRVVNPNFINTRLIELVSDHLPIAMTCVTDARDDDN